MWVLMYQEYHQEPIFKPQVVYFLLCEEVKYLVTKCKQKLNDDDDDDENIATTCDSEIC